MIWLLTIPFIIFFTFKDIIQSNCLYVNGGMSNANFLEWSFTIFVGLFISFLLSLIPIGIAYWIGGLPKRSGKVHKEYPLIQLKQKDDIEGRFFLGIGSIKGCEYYFWYRKNEDGSIVGDKTFRCSSVRIFEKEGTAIMRTFEDQYKSKFTKYYIWIIGISREGEISYYPDFVIPKNSIQNNYSL